MRLLPLGEPAKKRRLPEITISLSHCFLLHWEQVELETDEIKHS